MNILHEQYRKCAIKWPKMHNRVTPRLRKSVPTDQLSYREGAAAGAAPAPL